MASGKNTKKDDLLKNKRAVEEINRHLWIESEKAGYDIGFDKAAVDWLENFSKAWMNYHMPEKTTNKPSASSKKSTTAKSSKKKEKKS